VDDEVTDHLGCAVAGNSFYRGRRCSNRRSAGETPAPTYVEYELVDGGQTTQGAVE